MGKDDNLSKIKQFTLVLLELPDGRYVLQRRTEDAPYGAGLLGIFGGYVEDGETPDVCAVRELKEETSLDVDGLDIVAVGDFVLPKSADYPEDRQFFLYRTRISNMNFEVYEGQRAEVYTMQELTLRTDLTPSTRYVLEHASLFAI